MCRGNLRDVFEDSRDIEQANANHTLYKILVEIQIKVNYPQQLVVQPISKCSPQIGSFSQIQKGVNIKKMKPPPSQELLTKFLTENLQ